MEKRIYQRRGGLVDGDISLHHPRERWEVLTTRATTAAAASKAEYTPQPGIFAPKRKEEVVVEEVVTPVVDPGVVEGRLRAGREALYDYVRVGDRSASTSPILSRRRFRSTDS